MVSKQKFFLQTSITLGACILVGFFATVAQAADLVISPSSGSYSSGQTFTATVRAVPSGETINAIEATLGFDPAQLSVVSVSKSGSVFDLWTTEPAFSNSAGTVTFGGGTTRNPFTTTSNIVNVTFRVVGDGAAGVTIDEASVLAADGRGTDVFQNGTGGTYTLAAGAAPAPTPEPVAATPEPVSNQESDSEEAIIFGDPPRPPEIGSPTFLDADAWYNSVDGLFTWTLPFDVTAVAVEVSDSQENVPQDNDEAIIDPPTDEFAVNADNTTDGVQYVSINFQNQVGWGAATNRQLKIDTTAPEPFQIVVNPGSSAAAFPTLVFGAEDLTSGIDYYELTIDTDEPITITPAQAELGYLLGDLEDGTYSVYVTAYDMAGNSREADAAVLITAGWTKPIEVEETRSFWDYFTWINLLLFFLFATILLLLIYIWYERKQLRLKEEKLRRETREIQDQMEKIFSALRDEIYDQVNHITKRKRLSEKEKEAVEGLTQALEVSETLIEKEISDVKTILK